MSATALFERFNERLRRLFVESERRGARDGPEAPAAGARRPSASEREPTRLGGHAEIVDAARRAGLDPGGGVAPQDRRAARHAALDAMRECAPGELIALGAHALKELVDRRPSQTAAQRRAAEAVVHELTRMTLPWRQDQAAVILEALKLARDATAQRLALELAVSAARQAIDRAGHSPRLLPTIVNALREPARSLPSQRLRAELCVLLPRSEERSNVAATAFTPAMDWTWRQPWTGRLRRELTAGPPLTDSEIRLLAHLPRSAPAVEPSAAWRNRCRGLAAGPAAVLPGRLLAIAIDALRSATWISPTADDVRLLAGAAWAAAALHDRPALELVERLGADLARVAQRGQEPLVAACARAIVATATERRRPQDAWMSLAVLRQATRRARLHELLDDAVGTLLARTDGVGETATFGLDAAGRREISVTGAVAVLAVEGDGVPLRWLGQRGRPVARIPASRGPVPAAEMEALRRLARAAMAALTVHEPLRLEWLLRRGRVWEGEAWRREVLGHPLTGPLARKLLWQVRPGGQSPDGGPWPGRAERSAQDGGSPSPATGRPGLGDAGAGDGIGWVTVLPAEDGTLMDAAGRPTSLPGGYHVRLWHPAGADGIDAQAWTALRGRQPIAQLNRTTYHPTPAEAASGHRSARFAGHQVSSKIAAARLAARGWAIDRRLAATLELPDRRVRAVFSLVRPQDPKLARSVAVTDMVAFEQRSAVGTWAPLAVPEVPPRIFSEVMGDLDQMVRAARDQTVALREQIASLLPRLHIADRCRLEGRDLHVRGARGSYRISLANAAVYELRHGRHVCIVSTGSGDVPVPTDPELDGERLRLVLSKAFLLADDERITDQVILSQLSPG